MMLGNTKEGFSTIELERIEFIKDCRGEGVQLPRFQFLLSETDQSIETKETTLDAEKAQQVSVPDQGIVQAYVRYTATHVRELRLLAGSGGPIVMKSVTIGHKDGTT